MLYAIINAFFFFLIIYKSNRLDEFVGVSDYLCGIFSDYLGKKLHFQWLI